MVAFRTGGIQSVTVASLFHLVDQPCIFHQFDLIMPVLGIGLFSTFEYFKYQFSKALRDIRALSQIPVTVRKNVSWHFSNAYLSQ